jgi:hypothetical protein
MFKRKWEAVYDVQFHVEGMPSEQGVCAGKHLFWTEGGAKRWALDVQRKTIIYSAGLPFTIMWYARRRSDS